MKSLSFLAAAVMTSLATFSATAAETGTITFNGSLTDTTCNVVIDGQSEDATITLPTTSTSILKNANDTAGRVNFIMKVSDCTIADGMKSVAAFFQAGANVDPASGRLNNKNEGTPLGATNVKIQILDGQDSYKPIKLGSSDQITKNGYKLLPVGTDGSVDLVYGAEYFATAKSTAGTVTSSVVYQLQYK